MIQSILAYFVKHQDRIWIAALLILGAIVLGSILFAPPPLPELPNAQQQNPDLVIESLEGRVLAVLEEETTESAAGTQTTQRVQVEITSRGELHGATTVVESSSMVASQSMPQLKKGTRVVIGHTISPAGEQFFIADVVRRPAVFWLIALFIAVTIAVGRWTGLRSLLGLAWSVLVIARFVLPRILSGQNPIVIGITGALLLVVPSLYLVYGWKAKTHAAALSMLGSVLLTWGLATLFTAWAHLTGFGSEEGTYLTVATAGQINLRGVVLGGILIGTLGVLDDVTIGQASSIFQLYDANPALSVRELFRRGMIVGRDHIASMVNTLIMAYVGAALPLFLLLTIYQEPLLETLNRELFVEEIVRTLVGSLGLIVAVPLTSLLASILAHRTHKSISESEPEAAA